jgi:hypothetical protein
VIAFFQDQTTALHSFGTQASSTNHTSKILPN